MTTETQRMLEEAKEKGYLDFLSGASCPWNETSLMGRAWYMGLNTAREDKRDGTLTERGSEDGL